MDPIGPADVLHGRLSASFSYLSLHGLVQVCMPMVGGALLSGVSMYQIGLGIPT